MLKSLCDLFNDIMFYQVYCKQRMLMLIKSCIICYFQKIMEYILIRINNIQFQIVSDHRRNVAKIVKEKGVIMSGMNLTKKVGLVA